MWAALGLRYTLAKVLTLLPAGLLLGMLPPLQITGRLNVHVHTFWAAAFSCQVLISLGTLLALRSCGWRLCRMPDTGQAAPIEDADSSENSNTADLS